MHFDFDESTARTAEKSASAPLVARPTGKFWGEMRLGVRPDLQGRVRGGYAGFRSKARRSLSDLWLHS